MDRVRILLLEDSPLDADLLREYLLKMDRLCDIDRVETREAFTAAVESGAYDLILADYSLPTFDGMSALAIAHEASPATPFIFVSGTLGEEIAVESLKKGATDYLVKQRLHKLPAAVERALDEAKERAKRQRAEQRQRLLVAELTHRVKNTLATVMTIAQQTVQRSTSLSGFEAAFMGRLQALANAHALVFQTNWDSTDLKALLQQALSPFQRTDGYNVTLDGPVVMLWPQAALTLSLVLHELATNAAKYGALSASSGRVEVRWTVDRTDGRPRLCLSWIERDGPSVNAPAKYGFGSALIRRSIGYELDGDVVLSFPETGVTCEISFPLQNEAGPLSLP